MAVTPVTIEALRRRLVEEHKATVSVAFPKGNWAFVGRKYGVSRTILWRIVHQGYEPRDRKVRRTLGLSETIQQEVSRDALGKFRKTTE